MWFSLVTILYATYILVSWIEASNQNSRSKWQGIFIARHCAERLRAFSHLILTTALWRGHCYFRHFPHTETFSFGSLHIATHHFGLIIWCVIQYGNLFSLYLFLKLKRFYNNCHLMIILESQIWIRTQTHQLYSSSDRKRGNRISVTRGWIDTAIWELCADLRLEIAFLGWPWTFFTV